MQCGWRANGHYLGMNLLQHLLRIFEDRHAPLSPRTFARLWIGIARADHAHLAAKQSIGRQMNMISRSTESNDRDGSHCAPAILKSILRLPSRRIDGLLPPEAPVTERSTPRFTVR